MRPFPLMVFAAGFGTRMGELTRSRPKPLVPVAGKALIDHALDLCRPELTGPVVVNLHYLGQQLADHLAGRDLRLSWEREAILDTGGGLAAALGLLLGPDRGAGKMSAVMTLNSDAVWTGDNPLASLARHWDGSRMDALLLLAPLAQAHGHKGGGDFLLDAKSGRISWGKGQAGAMVYLGAQIINPALLEGIEGPAFSLARAWDRALSAGRAYGCVHSGGWCDVGHPGGIATAEALLSGAAPGPAP